MEPPCYHQSYKAAICTLCAGAESDAYMLLYLLSAHSSPQRCSLIIILPGVHIGTSSRRLEAVVLLRLVSCCCITKTWGSLRLKSSPEAVPGSCKLQIQGGASLLRPEQVGCRGGCLRLVGVPLGLHLLQRPLSGLLLRLHSSALPSLMYCQQCVAPSDCRCEGGGSQMPLKKFAAAAAAHA